MPGESLDNLLMFPGVNREVGQPAPRQDVQVEEDQDGPSVSISGRAIGLLGVISQMNRASSHEGHAKALRGRNPEVLARVEGSVANTIALAHTQASGYLLEARQLFAETCSYDSLVQAGVTSELDAKDDLVQAWYGFRNCYMGSDNEERREGYVKSLRGVVASYISLTSSGPEPATLEAA